MCYVAHAAVSCVLPACTPDCEYDSTALGSTKNLSGPTPEGTQVLLDGGNRIIIPQGSFKLAKALHISMITCLLHCRDNKKIEPMLTC